ncbi:hypothetical protein [Halorarum halophilum]|nr:hypothetical protein [Halobaculum halophilum]
MSPAVVSPTLSPWMPVLFVRTTPRASNALNGNRSTPAYIE